MAATVGTVFITSQISDDDSVEASSTQPTQPNYLVCLENCVGWLLRMADSIPLQSRGTHRDANVCVRLQYGSTAYY